jgi:hypothetical protein
MQFFVYSLASLAVQSPFGFSAIFSHQASLPTGAQPPISMVSAIATITLIRVISLFLRYSSQLHPVLQMAFYADVDWLTPRFVTYRAAVASAGDRILVRHDRSRWLKVLGALSAMGAIRSTW